MKIQTVIVSEKGTPIVDPHDGFIIQGNIYAAELDSAGQPNAGLIGPNFNELGQIVRLTAFTKEELLDVLGYTVSELEQIHAKKYANRNLPIAFPSDL